LSVAGGLKPTAADAQDQAICSLSGWASDLVAAWKSHGLIGNAGCYAGLITSMDVGREMRDSAIAELDLLFPRAGYKVVGLGGNPLRGVLVVIEERPRYWSPV
jgi:hypothetical protein